MAGTSGKGGVKGRSGPPGNQNAFQHGLAAIQKRREGGIPTEAAILGGSMIGLNHASFRLGLN